MGKGAILMLVRIIMDQLDDNSDPDGGDHEDDDDREDDDVDDADLRESVNEEIDNICEKIWILL